MIQLRCLFVTTHFAPDYKYGGVVHSSIGLYKYISRLADFRLATVSASPESVRSFLLSSGSCYRSLIFHRLGISVSLVLGLWTDIRSAEIILVNGIFTMPVTLAQIYAVILGRPFIVAVRGGLEPWSLSHKRWKKFLYLKFVILPLLRRAKFIHTTSPEEAAHILEMGFENVCMVPNGVDVELFSKPRPNAEGMGGNDGRFIFLFMSRTDQEKGLDILISAYRSFCAANGTGGHVLKIVGPDLRGYLKSMNLDYAKENIEYLDGVYGEEKVQLICTSNVVVLPSYSENFGNIVAEALACSRPVITTTCTPWRDISSVGCGWYIRPERDALLGAMTEAFLLPKSEIYEMGVRGRSYIFNNFSWNTRAKELFQFMKIAKGIYHS